MVILRDISTSKTMLGYPELNTWNILEEAHMGLRTTFSLDGLSLQDRLSAYQYSMILFEMKAYNIVGYETGYFS